MVVIGVDAHKHMHTLVAVDEVGRILAERTIEASDIGHTEAIAWACARFGHDVRWGVEDCRHVSSGLERSLAAARQTVFRVPTILMKRTRRSARTPGKSDSLDAVAVAQAVLREPWLPEAVIDARAHDIKLLVDRRDDLVAQRTATTNRLLWRIHDLDASRDLKRRQMGYTIRRHALAAWLHTQTGVSAELGLAELADIDRLYTDVAALEKRIFATVTAAAPALLALPGCAELTAAKIVGETAGVGRFKSEAAFAQLCGVAPIPSSSANSGRMRSTKYGNRQLNAALHRIAVTQIRLDCPGRVYYRKRLDAGDTSPRAIRSLKRRLARVVYQRLRTDTAH